MSVVIHGIDGLFLEIFDGTRSVMITDIAYLKPWMTTDIKRLLRRRQKYFPEPDTQTRQKIGPDTNS
jgi:hypothetical protein